MPAFSAAADDFMAIYSKAEYTSQVPGPWHSLGTDSQQSRNHFSIVGQQASAKPSAAHLGLSTQSSSTVDSAPSSPPLQQSSVQSSIVGQHSPFKPRMLQAPFSSQSRASSATAGESFSGDKVVGGVSTELGEGCSAVAGASVCSCSTGEAVGESVCSSAPELSEMGVFVVAMGESVVSGTGASVGGGALVGLATRAVGTLGRGVTGA